jgi:hypothetical protein
MYCTYAAHFAQAATRTLAKRGAMGRFVGRSAALRQDWNHRGAGSAIQYRKRSPRR